MRVRIVGWKVGFQKISLNKLLREYNKEFSLSAAKKAVDDILENKPVEFKLDVDLAKDFATKACSIGAIIELD